MKFTSTVILFLLLSASTRAQETQVRVDSVKISYSLGMRIETSYFNGKKSGMERSFYTDGKVAYETQYLDGKRNGINC